MTTYRIQFRAIVEREVEVPNDFTWTEAYQFARDQIGWGELANSAAARIWTDLSHTISFVKVPQDKA